MDRKHILEAIDACRPGSDDLAAELAAVGRRIEDDQGFRRRRELVEKWDRAIGDALADVPLPAGIEQRLLDRVHASASSATDQTAAEHATTGIDPTDTPSAAGTSRSSRRRWLWGGVAATLVAAASLLIALWFNPDPTVATSPEQLADTALQEFPHFDLGQSFEPVTGNRPARVYLAFRSLTPGGNLRWRPVERWLGRSGVVFDLGMQGGAQGWLFVLDAPGALDTLPRLPSIRADHQTAGRQCAVWQENGKLCVLIIEGGAGAYDAFVKSAPLA